MVILYTDTNTVLSITCGSLLLFINHAELHNMMCETKSVSHLPCQMCTLLAHGASYTARYWENTVLDYLNTHVPSVGIQV